MIGSGRNSQAASAYLEQSIRNEDPLTLVALVYDLASLSLARARVALGAGDMASNGEALHRFIRCMSLLRNTLDTERGREVARNLDRLYDYMLRRITYGNLHNDDVPLAEVAGYLRELGTAWREVASREPGLVPEPPVAQPQERKIAAAPYQDRVGYTMPCAISSNLFWTR